jgi:hypothetical protein
MMRRRVKARTINVIDEFLMIPSHSKLGLNAN